MIQIILEYLIVSIICFFFTLISIIGLPQILNFGEKKQTKPASKNDSIHKYPQ